MAGGISRRMTELGLRNFAFERTTVGGTTGLRGDFAIGEQTWKWDVFSQFHRSRTDEQARNRCRRAHGAGPEHDHELRRDRSCA